MSERRPRCIVIAGPNGAGKSTYSRDAFSADFLLLDPDRFGAPAGSASSLLSGRATIARVRTALELLEDFVLETTLSGRFPLAVMRTAKRLGYTVVLIFIGLDDADECIRRVALRVRAGGHAVPDADVRRRLPRSIANLSSALQFADQARIIDNSSVVRAYHEVVELVGGEITVIDDMPQWALRALSELEQS